MKILKGGGYIDFHVNKKKYESYKTERGKMNFVWRSLNDYLKKFKGFTTEHIEVRDLEVTSNRFWGEEICFINDLGYSASNPVPLNKDVLTIRNFGVDMIAIYNDSELEHQFPTLELEGVRVDMCSAKII